ATAAPTRVGRAPSSESRSLRGFGNRYARGWGTADGEVFTTAPCVNGNHTVVGDGMACCRHGRPADPTRGRLAQPVLPGVLRPARLHQGAGRELGERHPRLPGHGVAGPGRPPPRGRGQRLRRRLAAPVAGGPPAPPQTPQGAG